MSITSRICTFLLILAVLLPAISAQDDALSLSTFFINDSSAEESLTPQPHSRNSEIDSSLASAFNWLDTLHVGAICALHLEFSSGTVQGNDSAKENDLWFSSPVGRAPPA
jgi:hypothetical protein